MIRYLTLFVLLISASPAIAQQQEIPREWIDPDTGHRVMRLSDEPGSASLYFHQNPYTPDGQKLIITTPTGLSAINLKTRAIEALSLLPQVPAELARTIQSIDSPSRLADLIISFMDVKAPEKQEMLETLNLQERLDKVLAR